MGQGEGGGVKVCNCEKSQSLDQALDNLVRILDKQRVGVPGLVIGRVKEKARELLRFWK